MALTLPISPTQYNLSKNPVVAQIITDNLYINKGRLAFFYMRFITLGAGNGATLVFEWDDNIVVMTAAYIPDESGNQFHSWTGLLSLDAYVSLVAQDFNKNYLINQDWNLIPYDNKIVFRAIKKQALVMLFTSYWPTIIEAANQAGMDIVKKENYVIVIDIYFTDIYGFTVKPKIISIELPPDDNGVVAFDISKILSAYLKSDLPISGQNTITRCDNLLKKYRINYYEKYGVIPTEKIIYSDTLGRILKGGISFEEFPFNKNFIDDYIIANQKFLTWQPGIKYIHTDQPEYLYYLSNNNVTTFSVNFKVYFSDGTNTTSTLFSKTGVSKYEIFIIPTGYTLAGVGNVNPAKTVIKYQVTINNGADVSETITYIIDTKKYLDTRYYLFENSISGIDTLRTAGIKENGYELDYDLIEKDVPFDYSIPASQFEKTFPTKQGSYVVSTGWKSKEYIDYLEDLFLSKNVFEVIAGEHIPIIITSKKQKPHDSLTNVFALTFEYTHAYKNTSARGDTLTQYYFLIDSAGNYFIDNAGYKLKE